MMDCYICNCPIQKGEKYFNKFEEDPDIPTGMVHDDCLLRRAEFDNQTGKFEQLLKDEPWDAPRAAAVPKQVRPAQTPQPGANRPKATWRLHIVKGALWMDTCAKKPGAVRRFFFKLLLGWEVEDL